MFVRQGAYAEGVVSTSEEKSPPNLVANVPAAKSCGLDKTKRIVIPDPYHPPSNLDAHKSVGLHVNQLALLRGMF
jgi:hypothetical protein